MTPQDTAVLLEEAANDLEKLVLPKDAVFNMDTFGRHYSVEGLELGVSIEDPNSHLCGTSACAVGWLSFMGKWQKRGLKGKWKYHSFEAVWCPFNGTDPYDWFRKTKKVFGINLDENIHLFNPTEYNVEPTKEVVVKRIRKLAEKYRNTK